VSVALEDLAAAEAAETEAAWVHQDATEVRDAVDLAAADADHDFRQALAAYLQAREAVEPHANGPTAWPPRRTTWRPEGHGRCAGSRPQDAASKARDEPQEDARQVSALETRLGAAVDEMYRLDAAGQALLKDLDA